MAGVKGKSGGARPNSGGARPGAGRKKKVEPESANSSAVSVEFEAQPHGGALKRERAVAVPAPEMDMLALLTKIALGQLDASPIQVRAAIAAVQYTHVKKAEGGKKDGKQKAAEEAAGKFNRQAPPKLVAANGKQV